MFYNLIGTVYLLAFLLLAARNGGRAHRDAMAEGRPAASWPRDGREIRRARNTPGVVALILLAVLFQLVALYFLVAGG